MYIVFYQTSDVFEAEEKLESVEIKVEIVPTPVQDKAYCGVCIKIKDQDYETAKAQLTEMEYQTVS